MKILYAKIANKYANAKMGCFALLLKLFEQ